MNCPEKFWIDCDTELGTAYHAPGAQTASYVLHPYVDAYVQQATIAQWKPVNEAAFVEVEPSAESQAFLKTLLSIVGVKSRNAQRDATTESPSVLQNPSPLSEGGADLLCDQSTSIGVSQHLDDVTEHSQLVGEAESLGAFEVPAEGLHSVLSVEVEGQKLSSINFDSTSQLLGLLADAAFKKTTNEKIDESVFERRDEEPTNGPLKELASKAVEIGSSSGLEPQTFPVVMDKDDESEHYDDDYYYY